MEKQTVHLSELKKLDNIWQKLYELFYHQEWLQIDLAIQLFKSGITFSPLHRMIEDMILYI